MLEGISMLVERHPSVRQGRAIGAFGCLDLMDAQGNYVQKLQGPVALAAARLKSEMLSQGLIGLFRPPFLHCAPPLVITEAELRDGFQRLDRSLDVFDEIVMSSPRDHA